MRKLRTSGSVGGRAGNRSVYPTRHQLRTFTAENSQKQGKTPKRLTGWNVPHVNLDNLPSVARTCHSRSTTKSKTCFASSSAMKLVKYLSSFAVIVILLFAFIVNFSSVESRYQCIGKKIPSRMPRYPKRHI